MSPLVGRLLWHVGDWGRASEHIGRRWEEVAPRTARDRVLEPGDQLIVLGDKPELSAAVFGTTLSHADALRVHPTPSELLLEPLDFKWSLETASVRQVSAGTLARLLEQQLPHLEAELAAARANLGLPGGGEITPVDGRFVAPEHPANRAALRADPDLPSLLLPLDPQAFFQPLPAWPAARALARLEGVEIERVRSVEAVERYYRLGAGVAGALARTRSSLFDPEATGSAETAGQLAAEAIADLRQAGSARTVNLLLVDLERKLAQRRAREERLVRVPGAAFPFGRFRTELGLLRVPRRVRDDRRATGRLYAEVMAEALDAVRAEGRALAATGLEEEQVLEQLEARLDRWATLAREHTRLTSERLRSVELAPPAPEPLAERGSTSAEPSA